MVIIRTSCGELLLGIHLMVTTTPPVSHCKGGGGKKGGRKEVQEIHVRFIPTAYLTGQQPSRRKKSLLQERKIVSLCMDGQRIQESSRNTLAATGSQPPSTISPRTASDHHWHGTETTTFAVNINGWKKGPILTLIKLHQTLYRPVVERQRSRSIAPESYTL